MNLGRTSVIECTHSPCPPRRCASCTSNPPHDISVTIALVINGSCTDCANINSTFTLVYQTGCLWAYFGGPTVCSAVTQITATLSGGTLDVAVGGSGLGFTWHFSGNAFGGGSSGDCNAWSGLSLPLTGPNPFTYANCGLLAATCSVTSL